MLHGKGGSIGCISVSDSDMEEIFYLTVKVGIDHTRILICPYDFRKNSLPTVSTGMAPRPLQST